MKSIYYSIALILCFTLASCGGNDDNDLSCLKCEGEKEYCEGDTDDDGNPVTKESILLAKSLAEDLGTKCE